MYACSGAPDAPPDKIAAKWTAATGWVDITYDLDAAMTATHIGTQAMVAPVAGAASSDLYVAAAAARQYPELAIILNSTQAPSNPPVYYAPNVFDGSTWKRATGATGTSRGRWMDIDQSVGMFAMQFDGKEAFKGDVTAGIMAVSPAAASLDFADSANHGIWLGWWVNGKAGAYMVAAEATGTTAGTVYKTWDRFASIGKVRPATGYTAAPSGAKAKMIAIGAPQATSGVGRIAVVHDTGGATTWDISYPDATFASWDSVALPAQIDHERPRPWCLTNQLWFVGDVGGFPDPRATAGISECVEAAVRSPDGGANWASTAVGDEACVTDEIGGLARFAIDAGGRVWAARQRGTTTGHPVRTEIYYSDNQGATGTWVLSGTLTYPSGARRPYALLCHPSDQNIIALISCAEYAPSGGDKGAIIYMTETRGAPWTQRNATVASGNNFALTGEPPNAQSFRAMMLPNGRLTIMSRQTTSSWFTIHTSDDKGATWQLR
ncbi:MAG: hypothetical protein MUP15_10295, partial [Dehalococcoidia bacterium]|nr:hypothetical protein [Dehalococcoidia bacterium]